MGDIVTVNFRGDTLYGFRADDGVFIALKPIVEGMGMSWGSQYNRVMRDPILSEAVSVMKMPFGAGGGQEAVCLKEDLIQGFLFTIDSARIKNDEVRERVILYQRECYGVLHDHFRGKARGRNAPEVEGEPDDKPLMSERLRQVTEARQTFGTDAARELWFQNGLPITPAMLKESSQGDLFRFPQIVSGE